MSSDTVTVPVSAVIFLGGTIITMLGGLFTICANLLVGIQRSLNKLVTDMAVDKVQTEARLSFVERHAATVEEEKRWTDRHNLTHSGGHPNVAGS